MKNFFKSNWVLILILLIAIFFRFYHIQSFPNGLFPDEAANGLDINSMFHGDLQPFYERGNGRESLFFYMLWLSVAIFGRGPWQHHIVTATVGVCEILVAYFLAKRLFGKPIALLSSFFMAVSSYAVMLNHNGFRANTIPLFTSLTFLFIVKFFQTPAANIKSRIYSAFWAGVSFGLGFYTYIAYRIMPVIIIGLAVLVLFAFRGKIISTIKKQSKGIEWATIGFILSFAWIASYWIAHPASFVGRANGVSIFNADLNHGDLIGTFKTVVQKTILGFFTHGDLNWRQNVSGYPFLSAFISPFFGAAIIWFTWQCLKFLKNIWNKKLQAENFYMVLIAVWFWFMLLPEITTDEGIPHGLRLIGVIPPIFILSAWGVYKFWELLKKITINQYIQSLAAAVFFVGLIYYNFFLVFQVAAKSPDFYYAYRSDLTDVSNYVLARNDKQHTYLSLDAFSVQTTDYLTTVKNQPYQLLDPASSYQVTLQKGDQIIFTMSTLFDSQKFCQNHPTAQLVNRMTNQFGLTTMTVYEQRNIKTDSCKPIINPGFNTNPTQN